MGDHAEDRQNDDIHFRMSEVPTQMQHEHHQHSRHAAGLGAWVAAWTATGKGNAHRTTQYAKQQHIYVLHCPPRGQDAARERAMHRAGGAHTCAAPRRVLLCAAGAQEVARAARLGVCDARCASRTHAIYTVVLLVVALLYG